MTTLKSASILVLTSLIFLSLSCSKKDVQMEEPLINPSAGAEGSASGSTPEGSPTGEPLGDAASSTGELQTVYFDYDQFNIRSDARSALKSNAQWLKTNSSARAQIAGHCDERGTTEYNLALGQKRANSVRDYLVRAGVSRNRLNTLSFGEEQPSDSGHDESAWAKNRRAEFSVSK